MFTRLFLTVGLTFCSVLAVAGSPTYMKVPGIKGDSQSEEFAGHIELINWFFGLASQNGICNKSDITVTKFVDGASGEFIMAAATGKFFKEVDIKVGLMNGPPQPGTSSVVFRVTLFDAEISSYNVSFDEGKDRPLESVSLRYSRLEGRSRQVKSDGSFSRWDKFTIQDCR